jgi:TRAP-type uncharacterized transport system fused permease subunit
MRVQDFLGWCVPVVLLSAAIANLDDYLRQGRPVMVLAAVAGIIVSVVMFANLWHRHREAAAKEKN